MQDTQPATRGESTGKKKYFLLKLVAPRPSFASDITDAELEVMQEHGTYLKQYVDTGEVIVMGPVLDPKGSWGVAILEVHSEDKGRFIAENDPSVLSGLGFQYEIYPMLRAVVRK